MDVSRPYETTDIDGVDLSFFREHGYQILRGIFDPSVAGDVRSFLETELEASVIMLRDVLQLDEIRNLGGVAEELIADGRFSELDFDIQQLLSGHFALKTRLSDRLWTISRQPRIRALLATLFHDDRLFMHMPPAARWVLPGYSQSSVPAHQ